MRIDKVKNAIPNNRDFTEHVAYIFEKVLGRVTAPDAVYDIIGLEHTGRAVVEYLAQNCKNCA